MRRQLVPHCLGTQLCLPSLPPTTPRHTMVTLCPLHVPAHDAHTFHHHDKTGCDCDFSVWCKGHRGVLSHTLSGRGLRCHVICLPPWHALGMLLFTMRPPHSVMSFMFLMLHQLRLTCQPLASERQTIQGLPALALISVGEHAMSCPQLMNGLRVYPLPLTSGTWLSSFTCSFLMRRLSQLTASDQQI